MALLEDLKELGVDTDKALKLLNGKTALYEKMLIKFYDMLESHPVSPDFTEEECNEVIEKAHALKGTSGNLAVTPLYHAYGEIVQLLRENRQEEAREEIRKVLPVRAEIMRCIEKYK